MSNNLPVLITIPPSHYCDKVRWAMNFVNYKYKEDSYPPVFHMIGTKKHKARSVPILVTESKVIKDSTDILKFIDKDLNKLYPVEIRKEVENLEDLFDKKLGPHTRRFAYFHLFNTPQVIFEDFCDTTHPFYDSMYQTFFPIFKLLIKQSMKISPQGTEKSLNIILEVFKTVEEKLSDGRKYLTGNQLTAADITFATLGAPVIMPRNYKAYKQKKQIDADLNRDLNNEEPIDFIDSLSESFATEIRELRKTKAGKFITFLYKSR